MKMAQTRHRRRGESGLVQRVRARLADLPVAGVPSIVVGVSGGVDSLALAGVLAELSRQGAVTAVAVHVDHRLRPESGDEQGYVAEQVEHLGIEFEGVRLETGVRGRHAGVGLEEAARRERFAALARVARQRGTDAIALAHHQTDQAETVLLHLLRGAGLHGMSGIAEWTVRPIPWWGPEGSDERPEHVAIWRPFIAESKATLAAYAEALGVTPLADPTNASPEFTRNRIRHELLPLMDEISPGSAAALVRFATLAAAEDAYLDSVAGSALAALRDDQRTLRPGALSSLDVVVQRRVIREWLQAALPYGSEIGQERVDAVRALALSGQGGATIQVGGGWHVVRSGGRLRVERKEP